MSGQMLRRTFLLAGAAGLASAAAARTFAQQRVHRVGTLVHGTQAAWRTRIAALREGLKALGYVEGRNLVLLSRWNDGPLDRLPDIAAELVLEKPDVVVTGPALASAAVHTHSQTLPIVQATGAGAVKIGLARSFARPGGNVTGLETQSEDLTPKHLELLKTVAPRASRVAVLNTGKFLFHDEAWDLARRSAKTLKLELLDVRLSRADELPRLGAACRKPGCDALYAMTDPNTINWRKQVVELALRLRLPSVFYQPEFVEEGGLLSYSANIEDLFRRAASYVNRILKGARPADLPIERPSKFDLVINLKTARVLGLAVPGDLLARADRVIR